MPTPPNPKFGPDHDFLPSEEWAPPTPPDPLPDPLPPNPPWDWTEIGTNNGGEPNASDASNPWNTYNPHIDAQGRKISFDPRTGRLTVGCGQRDFEIDWDDLTPDLPPDDPPLSGDCDPATASTQITHTTTHTKTRVWVRKAGCYVLINVRWEYMLRGINWECRNGAWHTVGHTGDQQAFIMRTTTINCCRD